MEDAILDVEAAEFGHADQSNLRALTPEAKRRLRDISEMVR